MKHHERETIKNNETTENISETGNKTITIAKQIIT